MNVNAYCTGRSTCSFCWSRRSHLGLLSRPASSASAQDEIWPQIGPTGTDKLDVDAFFVDTLGLSANYMYMGVGNCLVVKRKGRCRNVSMHLAFLLNGLEAEAPRIADMKLTFFVPCTQTREHSHAATSSWCISLGFWWVCRVAARNRRQFINDIQFLRGPQVNGDRRSTFLTEEDDKLACRRNQEHSICFSSITYV